MSPFFFLACGFLLGWSLRKLVGNWRRKNYGTFILEEHVRELGYVDPEMRKLEKNR